MSEASRRNRLHNSLQGHVAMAKAGMRAIHNSPTTTPNAKRLAAEIQEKLHYLGEHVKIRVDPQ